MVIIGKNMDNIRAILEKVIPWAGRIERVPVVFARPMRSRMLTAPSPLLEFYFHARGRHGHLTVGDRVQAVQPGDLVILNAHFGNQGMCRNHWCYWCVSLEVRDQPLFDFLAAGPLLLKTRALCRAAVRKGFSGVAREYDRKGRLYDVRLKTAVLGFLIALWENMVAPSADVLPYSVALEKVLDHIHIHYADQNLRLDQLAAASHLSVNHFGRLFKHELGVSPVKYLAQYRIARARELIRRGNLSFKEIAFEVGFRDPLHFSRVFSALTGLSLREFRRQSD